MTASQGVYSIQEASIKQMSKLDPKFSTLEWLIFRSVVQYTLCLCALLFSRVPDPLFGPKGVRTLLVWQGTFGYNFSCLDFQTWTFTLLRLRFCAMFGVYYSLKYLALSEVTVLIFLAPSMTAILGVVTLGERIGVGQGLAGLLSMVDVLCIAQPAFLFGSTAGEEDPVLGIDARRHSIAIGAALIGVLGLSSDYTVVRAIGHRAHPYHCMAFHALQCGLVATIAMLVTQTPFVMSTQWLWLSVVILCAFPAQMFVVMGLQRETAGRGTTAIYTKLVFITLIENIFFDFHPSSWTVTGMIIIVASALYIAVSKPDHEIALVTDADTDEEEVAEGV
ncbi:drug/metabolite transporter superfamily [Armillaria mellea]|nr:drug/metabolite transporter superfamily [Armillaria mellea]